MSSSRPPGHQVRTKSWSVGSRSAAWNRVRMRPSSWELGRTTTTKSVAERLRSVKRPSASVSDRLPVGEKAAATALVVDLVGGEFHAAYRFTGLLINHASGDGAGTGEMEGKVAGRVVFVEGEVGLADHRLEHGGAAEALLRHLYHEGTVAFHFEREAAVVAGFRGEVDIPESAVDQDLRRWFRAEENGDGCVRYGLVGTGLSDGSADLRMRGPGLRAQMAPEQGHLCEQRSRGSSWKESTAAGFRRRG